MPPSVPELAHETSDHLAVPSAPVPVQWADITVLRRDAVPLENAVTPLSNVKAQGKPVYATASIAKGPMGEEVMFVSGAVHVKGKGRKVVANGMLVKINGVKGTVETSPVTASEAETAKKRKAVEDATRAYETARARYSSHSSAVQHEIAGGTTRVIGGLRSNAEQASDYVFSSVEETDNQLARAGLLVVGGAIQFGAAAGTFFTRLGEGVLAGAALVGQVAEETEAFKDPEVVRTYVAMLNAHYEAGNFAADAVTQRQWAAFVQSPAYQAFMEGDYLTGTAEALPMILDLKKTIGSVVKGGWKPVPPSTGVSHTDAPMRVAPPTGGGSSMHETGGPRTNDRSSIVSNDGSDQARASQSPSEGVVVRDVAKLRAAHKERARLADLRKQRLDDEAMGRVKEPTPEDRKWLESGDSERRKDLAYDRATHQYKVDEAIAGLEAESQGVLKAPVSRASDISQDLKDGDGRAWDAKSAMNHDKISEALRTDKDELLLVHGTRDEINAARARFGDSNSRLRYVVIPPPG